MPLNNKETMLQRQISLDRDDTETGLEALEEPLKARKRRESRQGISNLNKKIKIKTKCSLFLQAANVLQQFNHYIYIYIFASYY